MEDFIVNSSELMKRIEAIKPLDENAMKEARLRQDSLIKPFGSLGRLEDLAVQIAGITGDVYASLDKKAIVVMCADNGVYAEGVSTAPQEVTAVQAINMLNGKTAVAVLAKQGNIDLKVVDIGIAVDLSHSHLICKKIAYGTKNIALEAAMTEEECLRCLSIGFQLIGNLKENGYTLIGTGEMGISNTTTAEAVIMALTNTPISIAAGKGAGLTESQFVHKKEVLQTILNLHKPNANDPFAVLRSVGGFDIAGLTGCFLAAAYYRLPIVIDGVISIAAALLACKINPLVKAYLLPSHFSKEPAYAAAAKSMSLLPYFNLDMRLGEGSGCPFTMYLAEAAMRITKEMSTFAEGKVDPDNYIDIRNHI